MTRGALPTERASNRSRRTTESHGGVYGGQVLAVAAAQPGVDAVALCMAAHAQSARGDGAYTDVRLEPRRPERGRGRFRHMEGVGHVPTEGVRFTATDGASRGGRSAIETRHATQSWDTKRRFAPRGHTFDKPHIYNS
ncbi:hypothetical protein R1flu_003051 [Riccia fluitans]|uniref:Uncharacterized protein n=1 Tax=Riccia fluitans TaxID=41844 RepID=A0ABD1Y887_9MARC